MWTFVKIKQLSFMHYNAYKSYPKKLSKKSSGGRGLNRGTTQTRNGKVLIVGTKWWVHGRSLYYSVHLMYVWNFP